MSLVISSRVWEECEQVGERRLVMLSLAECANDQGICWPSQSYLAKRTRCTERGVQKMIDALLRSGEIELMKAGGGRGRSAEYRLSKYLKGEPYSGNTETKDERHSPNEETRKGEPQDTKGERGNIKGEQAVPPNRKEPSGTVREPSKRGKPRAPRIKSLKEVSIPSNLRNPEFRAAWEKYVQYRRDSRLKTLQPASVEAKFKATSRWVETHSLPLVLEAMEEAIAAGWQTYFEPKPKPAANGRSSSNGKTYVRPADNAEF